MLPTATYSPPSPRLRNCWYVGSELGAEGASPAHASAEKQRSRTPKASPARVWRGIGTPILRTGQYPLFFRKRQGVGRGCGRTMFRREGASHPLSQEAYAQGFG